MTTPTAPLDQFQLDFTEMFFCWSSFKFVQRLTFCEEFWFAAASESEKNTQILKSFSSIICFFWLQDNLIEMFLEWPSSKTVQVILISLKNWAARRHQERRKITHLYNTILIKVVVRFQDTNLWPLLISYFFNNVHSLQFHLHS